MSYVTENSHLDGYESAKYDTSRQVAEARHGADLVREIITASWHFSQESVDGSIKIFLRVGDLLDLLEKKEHTEFMILTEYLYKHGQASLLDKIMF